MSFLERIFGDGTAPIINKLKITTEKVGEYEAALEALSHEDLKGKTAYFKEKLKGGATLEDILPEAFATVREAARRTLNQRHYDVQLMGGLVLHQGKISEMKTGEGKTLVATLPAYLNALLGKGVHIVTVNDYLARRDAGWMGQVYDALGLSVSVIGHSSSYRYSPLQNKELDTERDQTGSFHVALEFLEPCTRKEAYQADITYGTNSEFGFDYLRDNLAYNKETQVQRGHAYAIVDEIDSILIDEARTPLIISSPTTRAENLYGDFARIAGSLTKDVDYTVDEKQRGVNLTDSGIEKAEKILHVDNIYTEKGIKYVHHLETAVRAKALFLRDRDYVVKDGEVIIVDPLTGRLQPGRRWSEGLHQAIEAKEGVNVKEESRTFASISYQNYFRLYEKLSGMTGTALTSAEEFFKVYKLETVPIPPNKPSVRLDHPDLIFQTELGKFKAIAKTIKELNKEKRPVLVGTVSIEKNEMLSQFLNKEGVSHKILNAKNHAEEGEIIAEAGKLGGVTIATNMAGRGVDIKLGGALATQDEQEKVKSLGGLFVLGTERHEARRIDNQLRGRSGRQGDPGETQFYVSLEDSLMRIFAGDRVKTMMGRFGIAEDEPIQNSMVSKALENAQGKIEGLNFDARKHLLEYDDVMNHQRKVIYERRQRVLAGGKEATLDFIDEALLGRPDAKNLEEAITKRKEEVGEDTYLATARMIILQAIDTFWVEHLEVMDYLRGSVNLRAYGQRDPLVEYKREGLRLFQELEGAIFDQALRILPHVGSEAVKEEKVQLEAIHESAQALTDSESREGTAGQVNHEAKEKIGRNDPCPCGSGKKYKNCGLANAPEHKN